MANKTMAVIVEMPLNDSKSTIMGEFAMVFEDEIGNYRGIPWSHISIKPFTMENALAVAVIDGFTHVSPALFWGIDDNNNAVYCIYKRVP